MKLNFPLSSLLKDNNMTSKHGFLFVISTLAFALSCSYLFSLAVMQTTLRSKFRYGAEVFPVTGNLTRMGNLNQCNGLWSCLEQSCQKENLPDAEYVCLLDFYLDQYPDTSCSFKMDHAFSWGFKFILFKVAFAFFALAVLSEVIALIVVIFVKHKWVYIVLLSLPCVLLLVAWILYGAYVLRYNKGLEDYPPDAVVASEIITSVLMGVLLVCLRSYLVFELISSLRFPSFGLYDRI